ncbi:hypothetical protein pb186bvf_014434 [Paramecium bursaria]
MSCPFYLPQQQQQSIYIINNNIQLFFEVKLMKIQMYKFSFYNFIDFLLITIIDFIFLIRFTSIACVRALIINRVFNKKPKVEIEEINIQRRRLIETFKYVNFQDRLRISLKSIYIECFVHQNVSLKNKLITQLYQFQEILMPLIFLILLERITVSDILFG